MAESEVIKILENKEYELWNGDCLEMIRQIPNESVDLILTDPPYENIIEEEQGVVLDVLQKGYMYKDKLLRPAMVKVNE